MSTLSILPIMQEADPGLWEKTLALPWIDQVGMVLIGIFMILGIWRGLWWQVIRLLGVIMSIALARALTPRLQPTVAEAFDLSPALSHGAVWFTIFVGGLVVATLLGLIGKKALEAMQLGLVDRAGGAVIGGLTGGILHSALLVIISSLGNADWNHANLPQDSASARWLREFSSWELGPLDVQARETIVERWADRWPRKKVD